MPLGVSEASISSGDAGLSLQRLLAEPSACPSVPLGIGLTALPLLRLAALSSKAPSPGDNQFSREELPARASCRRLACKRVLGACRAAARGASPCPGGWHSPGAQPQLPACLQTLLASSSAAPIMTLLILQSLPLLQGSLQEAAGTLEGQASARCQMPWRERLLCFHGPLPPLTQEGPLYPTPVITTLLSNTPNVLLLLQ